MQPLPKRRLDLVLLPEHVGVPVGRLLRRALGVSAAVIRRIKFLEDGILLDGVRVTTRAVGKEGQTLSALIGEEVRRSSMVSCFGPLDIIYEDSDVVVINKQAGVVVHPSPGHYDDTIGNFLLYHYDKIGFGGDFHPVHRLDSGTSGLLVVAKHPFAQEKLTLQMGTQDFKREYVAIGWGALNPNQGEIEAPIYHDGTMKRQIHPTQGQYALTQYYQLARGTIETKRASLYQIKLKTGRTHQIRVHFAHRGCPLIGDPIYGNPFGEMAHPALHAFRLRFVHPVTQQKVCFTAPVPEDFSTLMDKMEVNLAVVPQGDDDGFGLVPNF